MNLIQQLHAKGLQIEQDIENLAQYKEMMTESDYSNHFQQKLSQTKEMYEQVFQRDDFSVLDLISAAESCFDHLQLQLEAVGPVLKGMGYDIPLDSRSTTPVQEIHENNTIVSEPKTVASNKVEYPDSPTLQDLGLSSLTMGLLAVNIKNESIHEARNDRESIDSIPAPLLGIQPKKLDSLVNTITENEFNCLSTFLKSQLTPQYLNTIIYELNELVMEKRYMDQEKPEEFTVQELSDASKFTVARLKAVLNALLDLDRVECIEMGNDNKYKIKS